MFLVTEELSVLQPKIYSLLELFSVESSNKMRDIEVKIQTSCLRSITYAENSNKMPQNDSNTF